MKKNPKLWNHNLVVPKIESLAIIELLFGVPISCFFFFQQQPFFSIEFSIVFLSFQVNSIKFVGSLYYRFYFHSIILWNGPIIWWSCHKHQTMIFGLKIKISNNLLISSQCKTFTTRECGFFHTKGHNSWYMCEVNFVISSITTYNMCCLSWHILHCIWH